VSVLLLHYETERNLAVLSEASPPRLRVLPIITRLWRHGDWIHGYFRGRSSNFFAVYWIGGRMWVAIRDGVCELHPDTKEEIITLTGDWPTAELQIQHAGEVLLSYRYRRRLRHGIEDEEFPEHDLPAWLYTMWVDPEVDFARNCRKDGLFAV
jgi:hypothetical protein